MKKTKFDLLFEDIMSQFEEDDNPEITPVVDTIKCDDNKIIEIYQNKNTKSFGFSIAKGNSEE